MSLEPRELVLIGDAVVQQMPVHDCAEPLVDLGGRADIVIDDRLDDGTGDHRFVREGLADRLVRAASTLPEGLRLALVEGYRPRGLQRRYFEEYYEDLRALDPGMDPDQLRLLASRYVAPPDGFPPHCCGAAVDVTLVGPDGVEVDMGTAVNASPEASEGRCFFDAASIHPEARRMRDVLRSALTGAGLVNYPTEWWHWSWGDQYWALMTGAGAARYGVIDR